MNRLCLHWCKLLHCKSLFLSEAISLIILITKACASIVLNFELNLAHFTSLGTVIPQLNSLFLEIFNSDITGVLCLQDEIPVVAVWWSSSGQDFERLEHWPGLKVIFWLPALACTILLTTVPRKLDSDIVARLNGNLVIHRTFVGERDPGLLTFASNSKSGKRCDNGELFHHLSLYYLF